LKPSVGDDEDRRQVDFSSEIESVVDRAIQQRLGEMNRAVADLRREVAALRRENAELREAVVGSEGYDEAFGEVYDDPSLSEADEGVGAGEISGEGGCSHSSDDDNPSVNIGAESTAKSGRRLKSYSLSTRIARNENRILALRKKTQFICVRNNLDCDRCKKEDEKCRKSEDCCGNLKCNSNDRCVDRDNDNCRENGERWYVSQNLQYVGARCGSRTHYFHCFFVA